MSLSVRACAIVLCIASAPACQLRGDRQQQADARAADATPPSDAPPSADAYVWPPRLCTHAEPTAQVSGTTPLGLVHYTHAWPSYFGGKCSSLSMHFTVDAEVDANQLTAWPPTLDTLSFWLSQPWPQGFVGDHQDVSFEVRVGGESAAAKGHVTIESFEEPYPRPDDVGAVRGTFMVTDKAAGWALEGRFEAAYCEHLITLCP